MSNLGTTWRRATGSGSLHKNDWLNMGLLAAAAAATVMTGGAAAPALGAAAGEGAAAGGAGAAGLGAAEFGGQFAAGTAGAELGGAGAAGSGLLGAGTGAEFGGQFGTAAAEGLAPASKGFLGALPASDFTAAASGDAYLPGSLGAGGNSASMFGGSGASLGSRLGGQFANGLLKPTMQMLKAANAANSLMAPPPGMSQAMASGTGRPPPQPHVPNTQIPTMAMPGTGQGSGLDINDPKVMQALVELLKKQGGMG